MVAIGPGRRHRRLRSGPAAKPAKLAVEPRLRVVVEAKLAGRWSPQQITGWLPLADLRIRCWGVARDDLPVAVRPEPGRAAW